VQKDHNYIFLKCSTVNKAAIAAMNSQKPIDNKSLVTPETLSVRDNGWYSNGGIEAQSVSLPT
jgi:hypothetical protein